MKNKEQLSKEYADKIRPIEGLDKYDAPFLTAFEHHEDISDAFIAGYEAVTTWIDINDKLPEKYKYVFVLSSVGDAYVTMYDGMSFASVAAHPVNITHWLPIPKLPTK